MNKEEDRKGCLWCFQVLPLSAFGLNPRGTHGRQARCRSCECNRLQIRRHGLTRAQKEEIARAQGGCAICGRDDPGAKGWAVDHDRQCCPGELSCIQCRRGVLCSWCNSALGYARDNPAVLRRMADYLESKDRITVLAPGLAPKRRKAVAPAVAGATPGSDARSDP